LRSNRWYIGWFFVTEDIVIVTKINDEALSLTGSNYQRNCAFSFSNWVSLTGVYYQRNCAFSFSNGVRLALTLLRARIKVSRSFVHALSSRFACFATIFTHALSSRFACFATIFAHALSSRFACFATTFSRNGYCSFAFSRRGVQGRHFGGRLHHRALTALGTKGLSGVVEPINSIRAVCSKLSADLFTLSNA
jgi:hypothetical protein